MDYGKYKNALEKAKVRYNEIKGTNCSEEKFLLELFPELKENKDRIRQGLIKALSSIGKRNWGGIDVFESIAWLEKQGEQKVPINDFKAKDWYVSEVDGKIHDVTYNAADNVEKKGETKNEQEALNNWYVEYVYILDYSTGRVIVAKHDVEESISELFEQLGLKESQCQYMVSTDILSIEYINF